MERDSTQARRGTRSIVWRSACSAVTLSVAGSADQALDPTKADMFDPFDFSQANDFSADGQQADAVQTPAANAHLSLIRLVAHQRIAGVVVACSDRASKLGGGVLAAHRSVALAPARLSAVSGARASHSLGSSRSLPLRAPMVMARRGAST